MQVLKLTWAPTGQVFAQPKTFEEAVAVSATRVLRAGYRSFRVSMHDDGESFDVSGQTGEVGNGGLSYVQLVTASPGERVHHFAGTGLPGKAKEERSELQSTSGKPPASGWYKGRGRRFDLATDPRSGPYFLVFVDAEDRPCGHESLEALVREASNRGCEYPLDAALAAVDLRAKQNYTIGEPTFALVLRDDNPPKLRFKDKWDGSARSMQVVYRRPL